MRAGCKDPENMPTMAKLFASGVIAVAGLVATFGPVAAQTATAATAQVSAGASGLPLPRFVSLKSDRVNMRSGPGTEYPTSWVFKRIGMPVEVLKEFEGWRQIRDSDGTTGWVLGSNLSGRRTAVVQPWDIKSGQPAVQTQLTDDADPKARVVAVLEAGVLGSVMTCSGRWCRIAVGEIRGYIEQKRLWGVYDGEIVK
jgi:SH3-like domain-containing protein